MDDDLRVEHLNTPPRIFGAAAHEPVAMPAQVGAFRFAHIHEFDGEGRHTPATTALRLDDEAERDRVLAYLSAGAAVILMGEFAPDMFKPESGAVVPLGYRTDGEWIWSEACAYYLRVHHLAPDPELTAHMARRGFRPQSVAENISAAALNAVFEGKRISAEQVRRERKSAFTGVPLHLLARGEDSNQSPTTLFDGDAMDAQFDQDNPRFSVALERVLLEAGWMPGRDASGRVEPWLNAIYAYSDSKGDDRPARLTAAEAVVREFGLLDVVFDFREPTPSAACLIRFFPMDVRPEYCGSRWIASRVGQPAFPVAQTSESDWLWVGEDGKVYWCRDSDYACGIWFAGETFDAAMQALVDDAELMPVSRA